MEDRIIGVLGGGQLGRMMAEAGHRMGVKLVALDPGGSSSPAGQVCQLSIDGSFRDAENIMSLASVADLITVEIEHVDTNVLVGLSSSGYVVRPNPQTIRVIQDKLAQKLYLQRKSAIKLAPFMEVKDREDAITAGLDFGYPYMLKSRNMAYDGRGNYVVHGVEEVDAAIDALKMSGELYAEQFVNFNKELAVMVVNSSSGISSYPVVETHQRDSICSAVVCPADISLRTVELAKSIAMDAVRCLPGEENYGVFGVELFLVDDVEKGESDIVLLNEIAPRPHNSGHYTVEACGMDQFEAHLRAVLGMPVDEAALSLRVNCACMINVLGIDSHMSTSTAVLRRALRVPHCGIHWYGKAECRKGRKLAHFTITAKDKKELHARVASICCIDEEDPISIPTDHVLDVSQMLLIDSANKPEVAVIMGSDSDLSSMTDAIKVLEIFQIPHEVTIVSAHRTPTRMYAFAQSAVERGLKVIIAGAGGAAHLPGMVAALTPLPVIGVPVESSALSGNDSLLSIVQMPRGVPVATVAIGNSTNAGLLAVKILAAGCPALIPKLEAFTEAQENEVLTKASRLETLGFRGYS